MKDKNRFMTSWNYATEGIKEEKTQLEMYNNIINTFLDSTTVTNRNKNNLLGLIRKYPSNSLVEKYESKIKNKKTSQLISDMEN